MDSDECELDFLQWSFHHTHKYQIIVLYSWNYDVIYVKLYLT